MLWVDGAVDVPWVDGAVDVLWVDGADVPWVDGAIDVPWVDGATDVFWVNAADDGDTVEIPDITELLPIIDWLELLVVPLLITVIFA